MENSLSFGLSIFIYRLVNVVTSAYTDLVNFYATNARIKATIKELGALSDRELQDIGITRDDIAFIAREGI